MIDPSIGGRGRGRGIASVSGASVRAPDGEAYELVVRDRGIAPEKLAPGEPSFECALRRGGKDEPCAFPHGLDFLAFASSAPFEALADPKSDAAAGLKSPRAAVSVNFRDEPPLKISVAAPGADGRCAVAVEGLDCVYIVAGEIADLLTPASSKVVDASTTDLWARILRPPQAPPGADQRATK